MGPRFKLDQELSLSPILEKNFAQLSIKPHLSALLQFLFGFVAFPFGVLTPCGNILIWLHKMKLGFKTDVRPHILAQQGNHVKHYLYEWNEAAIGSPQSVFHVGRCSKTNQGIFRYQSERTAVEMKYEQEKPTNPNANKIKDQKGESRKVQSVNCALQNVKCGVQSVECRVWSVKCGV